MPKSKKPRKRYVSGRHPISYPAVRRRDIEDIKKEIMSAETAVRIKLPRGEASYTDLSQVRDLFNCLMFSLMHRQKVIDQSEADAAGDELIQAGIDLTTVLKRGIATDHYVCRASEMSSILAGLQPASDFIRDSLDVCPSTLVDEFNGSLLIRDALPEYGEIVVQKNTVDMAYRLAQQMGKILPRDFPAWKKQATAAMRNHMEAISKGERHDR